MENKKSNILILDFPNEYLEIYKEALSKEYNIINVLSAPNVLDILKSQNIALVLIDFKTVLQTTPNLIEKIHTEYPKIPVALLSEIHAEEYIPKIKKWNVFTVLPKTQTFLSIEIPRYIENIINPKHALGLIRYLDHTIELYIEIIRTREDKIKTVEKVINHFATCGFEIHELYDVRLILEEMINNAFFHAFLDENGNEKYKISTFKSLAADEKVIIEYGSDSMSVGFSVTDNSGKLFPIKIIEKLERQYNKEGIFDESGRGIYLSRILSNRLIYNIEKGHQTQAIALFREKLQNELKPLCINYIE